MVRVRVDRKGRKVFLVRSFSTPGAVFSVDPSSWSCSCPDHHRRNLICKHGVSCYILSRISTGTMLCAGCRSRIPRRELIEVHENERYFAGDLICKRCADQAGVER